MSWVTTPDISVVSYYSLNSTPGTVCNVEVGLDIGHGHDLQVNLRWKVFHLSS